MQGVLRQNRFRDAGDLDGCSDVAARNAQTDTSVLVRTPLMTLANERGPDKMIGLSS